MRAEDIAVAFADRLGAYRSLTSDETDMLLAVIEKRRREWTQEELDTLQRGRAARRLMPAIARDIGRSAQAVRTKVRELKRKERSCG